MTTQHEAGSSSILALAAFFFCSFSALLLAQAPAGPPAIATKTLIQEPLGETADPKVTVLSLPIPGGLTAGAHTHKGPVFAYILQGDIENQVDPDPPKLYHPGDFFFGAYDACPPASSEPDQH